jgi:malate/lactate dehydrogenase
MLTATILGAGELGGAIAHALAARDRLSRILIVDAAGSAAAGKALDIQQMGSVDGFHTQLTGTDEQTRIAGTSVCIVADRFGKTSSEWQGDEGATMIGRLRPYLDDAPIVFAGAAQASMLLATVRDAGIPRRRAIGSAAEAFRSALAGIVAVEARCSPGEVSLTVLGSAGGFVVPWREASIGGYTLDHALTQVQLNRIEARAARLWPPGAYALGMAAARVAEAIVGGARRTFSVLTVLEGEFSVKDRVGALPCSLASSGIVRIGVPALSGRERTLVETALL